MSFTFLLVGNAPYSNRGCEAIVRGTVALLRREFGGDLRVTVASFGPRDEIVRQAVTETDASIRHIWLPSIKLPPVAPWSTAWWRQQFWRVRARLLRNWGLPSLSPNETERVLDLGNLDEPVSTTDCALQIGGDNYSLDYGLPVPFMRIDRRLWRAGIPVVLWGASIGPFDAHPQFAAEMFVHLKTMSGIYVRESLSYDYLRHHGVTGNLRSMSDPAFAMEAVAPDESKVGCVVRKGAIGFNFSPLMARFVTKGDSVAWAECCAEIVKTVSSHTGRPIVLVPHVTSPHSNDHTLLAEVKARASATVDVACVGDRLSAGETKWVISRCSVFVGARTHATIAAISSGVPTLSLAYSIKATGLNQDIFGSQEYCIPYREISPSRVDERVTTLLQNGDRVRDHIAQELPKVKIAASQAAQCLHNLVGQDRATRTCVCKVCRSQ
jgi:polysaccharide pyruvyl transferase WcaK-like protein